jgi:beta-lactamase class D
METVKKRVYIATEDSTVLVKHESEVLDEAGGVEQRRTWICPGAHGWPELWAASGWAAGYITRSGESTVQHFTCHSSTDANAAPD